MSSSSLWVVIYSLLSSHIELHNFRLLNSEEEEEKEPKASSLSAGPLLKTGSKLILCLMICIRMVFVACAQCSCGHKRSTFQLQT